MEIRLRYKEPNEDTSKKIVRVVTQKDLVENPSENFSFASAVAEFGLLLRDSEYKAGLSWDSVLSRAQKSRGKDAEEYRSGFLELVKKAKKLAR